MENGDNSVAPCGSVSESQAWSSPHTLLVGFSERKLSGGMGGTKSWDIKLGYQENPPPGAAGTLVALGGVSSSWNPGIPSGPGLEGPEISPIPTLPRGFPAQETPNFSVTARPLPAVTAALSQHHEGQE